MLLAAVHVHPLDVVTDTEPVPPFAANDCEFGEMEYVHEVAPDWDTVNVLPAIVMVPVRELVLEFAATEKETVPFPLPLAPPVTLIHAPLFEAAVHVHPLEAVTDTEPVPPFEVNDCEVGEMEYEQDVAPDCVTVKVLPAIVMDPVRELVLELDATLYETVPFPLPLAPPLTLIHPALFEAAVHVQPLVVVTETEPVPPFGANDCEDGEMEYVQDVAPDCVTVKVLPAAWIVPLR